jgi:hypothetical protein
MLIKTIDREGSAVPHAPAELVYAAVVKGLKQKNSPEWIYWAPKQAVRVEGKVESTTNPLDQTWQASATGECSIGKTSVRTEKFYDAKKCTFSVVYKSSKDELGLPDIEIVSFKFDEIETNPAKMVGSL